MTTTIRYLQPGRADRLLSSAIAALTRHGISVWGSGLLSVPGRRTGRWHQTAVNPLVHGGRRYLVSARGEAHWVRNLRVAGKGELRVGRRVQRITAVELADAEKPPVLRAYLKRWELEVGRFFDGVNAGATDAELLRIASDHPIFRVTFG